VYPLVDVGIPGRIVALAKVCVAAVGAAVDVQSHRGDASGVCVCARMQTKSTAVDSAIRALQRLAQYPMSRRTRRCRGRRRRSLRAASHVWCGVWCAAVALAQSAALGALVAKVRASGKPDGKLLAVRVIKELTADMACQPLLVEQGTVRQ
jgi:hypothetical protein